MTISCFLESAERYTLLTTPRRCKIYSHIIFPLSFDKYHIDSHLFRSNVHGKRQIILTKIISMPLVSSSSCFHHYNHLNHLTYIRSPIQQQYHSRHYKIDSTSKIDGKITQLITSKITRLIPPNIYTRFNQNSINTNKILPCAAHSLICSFILVWLRWSSFSTPCATYITNDPLQQICNADK